jgi:hypothetical protein
MEPPSFVVSLPLVMFVLLLTLLLTLLTPPLDVLTLLTPPLDVLTLLTLLCCLVYRL